MSTPAVIPVQYTAPGVIGDMQWMITSGLYPNSIFIFPDTYERFFLSTPTGTQNQLIRPYNLFGMYGAQPLSLGITIESLGFGPHAAITDVGVQASIDRSLTYLSIVMMIASYTGLNNIYFASRPSGTSDPPVFDNMGLAVGSDVIDYITTAIYALGTYTP